MAVVRTEFPHRVKIVESEMITLADGTRLAAKIWLPEDSTTSRVPAILEYLPYRKRDGTRTRDQGMHMYFAVTAMRRSGSTSAAAATAKG